MGGIEVATSKGRGWRARKSPQEYFAAYGRRVRCVACGTWQRTAPEQHAAGLRLREMNCKTTNCPGRLRTIPWWGRLEASLAEQRAKDARLPQYMGGIRLGVNVGSFLDDDEAQAPKLRH